MSAFDQRTRIKHLKLISIFVDNGLDQPVVVQLKANRTETATKAVNVCNAFQVIAGGSNARSFSAETSGWLPYLFVQIYCTATPTSGSLSIWRIRSRDDQEKLVDDLEIRDVTTKDPVTNPDEILIQEW